MTKLRNSKAFTLIELVAVIIILGILALIALFAYNTIINNSRQATLEAAGTQVTTAYKSNLGVNTNGQSGAADQVFDAMGAAGGELKAPLSYNVDAADDTEMVTTVAIDDGANCVSGTVSPDPTVGVTNWTYSANTTATDGACA